MLGHGDNITPDRNLYDHHLYHSAGSFWCAIAIASANPSEGKNRKKMIGICFCFKRP